MNPGSRQVSLDYGAATSLRAAVTATNSGSDGSTSISHVAIRLGPDAVANV